MINKPKPEPEDDVIDSIHIEAERIANWLNKLEITNDDDSEILASILISDIVYYLNVKQLTALGILEDAKYHYLNFANDEDDETN